MAHVHCWQATKESHPDQRIWNPLCYCYTSDLCVAPPLGNAPSPPGFQADVQTSTPEWGLCWQINRCTEDNAYRETRNLIVRSIKETDSELFTNVLSSFLVK